MSTQHEVEAICRKISQSYSACDISDGLLKLKVPQAGFLPDISPIPSSAVLPNGNGKPMIAPISTLLFVSKSHSTYSATSSTIPPESNIPKDKHWTDMPTPGTFAFLQQPAGQVCAVCGDILATRLKVRRVKGVIADGRVRDVPAMRQLVQEGNGEFTVWSRGYSTVGAGLEAKPWAADIPLRVGDVMVKPGDILCADADENGCVIIPREKLDELMAILPALKEADEKCVADVQAGVDVTEAFRRHRG